VPALIKSRDPQQFIQRTKQRDLELGKGWIQIVRTLPFTKSGGTQNLSSLWAAFKKTCGGIYRGTLIFLNQRIQHL
jgi:hypothetical protein